MKTTFGVGMKKSGSLLLLAFGIAAVGTLSSQPAFAELTTKKMQTQSVTTVVDHLTPGENSFLVHPPAVTGKTYKINDAMSFSESKMRKLETAQKSKTPIQLVIEGSTIVDIL
ncbi:MAG: hypothetical protein EOP06_31560 [Proteobacteria bacterium]|nr:MAG: hypothetical protein EOP06_31560 [Pseudomonadota bacterium]